MTRQNLRLLIIALLMVTGIFHLLVAMLGAAPGIGWPLAGFGVLYTVISFYVRRDTSDGSKSHSRNAIIAAIAACTLGLSLGGANYLSNGGPAALPIMFLIDIVVIGAGVMWLMKAPAKKS